jgi:hypothetical protein
MQACYVFTVVMQEIFIEVRARAIPVSSYIDDGITADSRKERCLWAVVLIVKLLNLLGAYFGLPKCHFEPSQEGEWLGFEVKTRTEVFKILNKKMAKVMAALSQLLSAKVVSPRQLAAVAGKLISLSPAVLPASLYAREFFQAIQGTLPVRRVNSDGSKAVDGESPKLEWKALACSAYFGRALIRRIRFRIWRTDPSP